MMWSPLALVAAACCVVFGTTDAVAQDSVAVRAAARTAAIQRAQRLVNDGSGAEGRAVVDSLLNATEPRSSEEAEILFWRATLAESWDQAQRDYLRVMLEHDASPFAAQAMLRLAQGEIARGDRDAALRYLERLATEAPASAVRPEAALWQGRLLMDRGARPQGCAVLRAQRPRVPTGALELERQYDYLLGGCPGAAAESTRTDAPPSDPAPTPAPAPTGPALVWSVQIAAFQTPDEAATFAAEMREKGYDTRVDGSAPPFRIRFGRFPTRAAAAAAMEEYRRKERADAFLTQVPRG
jgi:hypothetical protein